jgi:hypothetical protein
MRPEVCRRVEAIAARSPCWSRSELRRCGGPCDRSWRKGRSQRRTVKPESQNAPASATRSGESQFAPAPCVRTRQSPAELVERCRNPRTGASFCGASQNSLYLFISTAHCSQRPQPFRQRSRSQRPQEIDDFLLLQSAQLVEMLDDLVCLAATAAVSSNGVY